MKVIDDILKKRKSEFEKSIGKEIMVNERLRMTILAVVFGAMTLLYSIGYFVLKSNPELMQMISLPTDFLKLFENMTFTIYFGSVFVYEVIAVLVLKEMTRHKLRWPEAIRYVNAFIETSIPTGFILLFSQSFNSIDALLSPAPYLYFLFIMLSVLRLDFRLCLFTGFVAAIEYLLISMSMIGSVPISANIDPFLINPYHHIVKSVILFLGGLVPSLVTENIKKLVLNFQKSQEDQQRLQVRNEVMETELDLARRIQMKLIPEKSPDPNISFFYRSMEKVGGDFYDFFRFENTGEISIFISDVSGHGIPAALITTMIKGAIAHGGELCRDPAGFLNYLNEYLLSQTGGNFVTAFYAVYNPKSRTLLYANAGHNLPFILSSDRVSTLNGSKGIPLAVISNIEMAAIYKDYSNRTLKLSEGDKVFFYTDGLVEAVNIGDLENSSNPSDFETISLSKAFVELKGLQSAGFIKQMAERLIAFRGSESFDDDVCMICLDIV